MRTKIVYVVASSDEDIYMEQAIISAWSARYYNPDCQIEMVCDQDTYSTLNSGIRAQYKTLFNDIHVREFQPEQSLMERSRWLKTTLREIIDGDYLYLDTDTVVCANLSYVDDFRFDIGMVLDCNCEFSQTLVYEWVVPTMKKIYGIDVSREKYYFNSGVSFVRDCRLTRDFYNLWNEHWVYSLRHFGKMKDQQPLMKTNIDMGYEITELSGNLNCLVAESIHYLHTAHIVHFVNCLSGRSDEISPLYKDLFFQVKQYGLTEETKNIILNCKTSFCSPSMPVSREVAILWRHYLKRPIYIRQYEDEIKNSNSYYVISFVRHRFPWLMRINEAFLGVLLRLFKSKKEDIKN